MFEKLDQAGFHTDRKNLYILEGVLMYLDSQAVQETFHIMATFAGSGSRIVFDYIQASVLRRENRLFGAAELFKSVSKSGGPWRFGLEPDEIDTFAASYGFEVLHHLGASELEAASFQNTDGRRVRPVNAAHCLATLGKP